ncbi:piggyBac transposable element-derived protein 4-like [Ornithodoros turicata]|uniref:piggyBac transposable element-derived protein 4-like n=1 Tax=Ornithodoros turicata TaxID=34597 RepID=UPI003139A91A
MNFDKLVSDVLVKETIRYCEQKGSLFTTSDDEMRTFLGMNLIMSLPALMNYSSTLPNLGVPYVYNVMPLHRFEQIRGALHFANNECQPGRRDPEFDRAYKVRPLITHCNEAFQAVLAPTKLQSIDEHMIKFKGHNIMKQYLKNKPIRWGFKMWCRCDSETRYLFQ